MYKRIGMGLFFPLMPKSTSSSLFDVTMTFLGRQSLKKMDFTDFFVNADFQIFSKNP